eukprot:m.71672 g.71672  ORF g.71672 m.71672 type:complete len:69 (+) comp8358_c0_seq3:250-456(+)
MCSSDPSMPLIIIYGLDELQRNAAQKQKQTQKQKQKKATVNVKRDGCCHRDIGSEVSRAWKCREREME